MDGGWGGAYNSWWPTKAADELGGCMSEPLVRISAEKPKRLSQNAHRIAIGALGIALPPLVYVIAGIRETVGLSRWQPLDSVSAYYHTGAIGVFVGVLFAMALFLITYPGYEGFVWDRVVGKVGGAAGLGVALFPAGAPLGVQAPSWWRERTGIIHYSCALVLFATFVLFSVWLFRRSNIPERRLRPLAKRRRDDICLACGLGIVGCSIWAGVAALGSQSMLVPESLAIVAFSVSWLVKGEARRTAVDAVRALTTEAEVVEPVSPSTKAISE
jgi:hypothetical protein